MSCITKNEKEFLKDVLQNMDTPSLSVEDVFGYQDRDDVVYDNINDYTYEGEELFSDFAYGASKNVLYFNKAHKNKMIRQLADKIVIKVPMKYDECEDEFESADYCLRKLNKHHRMIGEEKYNECNWDYCNAEAEIYRYVDKRGCAEPLAETFYICDVEGYPFYGAEYMNGCSSQYSSSKRSTEIIDSIDAYDRLVSATHDYDFDSRNLKFYLALSYPIEVVVNLIRIFSKARIYDIYPWRNCGEDEQGRMKIIDYSDYNG